MAQYAEGHFGSSFYRELIRAHRRTRSIPVNQRMVETEGRDFLQAADRLQSYREFLERARQHKGHLKSTSREFEREIVSQARYARNDGRILVGRMLPMMRHFKMSGLMDGAWDAMHDSLSKAGSVQLGDLRQDVLTHPKLKASLRKAGMTDRAAEKFESLIPELTGTLFARDRLLVFRSATGAESSMSKRAVTIGRKSVVDLLFGNRFDAIVERFELTGTMRAAYVPASSTAGDRRHLDMYEISLAMASAAHSQINHHVRELEHIGMAKYSGEEPATIILVVAVALVILGGLILYACSEEEDPAEQGPACALGAIMVVIGSLLGLSILCKDSNQDPCFNWGFGTNSNGNPP
jgi:hypothetical protein